MSGTMDFHCSHCSVSTLHVEMSRSRETILPPSYR